MDPIKEKFFPQDFESLAHLVHKVSGHESWFQNTRRGKFGVFNFNAYDSSDEDSDVEGEIGVAEWVKSKKPASCPWIKTNAETYDFNITKADKIFDLLLQEEQIKLPLGHKIASAEELKKRKYCKLHNSVTHHTNDCKVFRQQIQMATEQGRQKVDDNKKPIKVDKYSFPAVNMVEAAPVDEQDESRLWSILLTSRRAKESGMVDPRV